ncbi:hypothetical protein MMC19_006641 [Ptychographa xylographoides]|nr:hypothetical protein [Ptychographa xylographoides]
MSLSNVWHLRTVAEASSKPCYICYKPSTSVLITPDNKDYFYTCRGHLTDKGFCSPIVNEAEVAAKKKKEEMEREIELVKKEYAEKMKKKKGKDKKDPKAEATEKDEKIAEGDDEQKAAEKEKDDKINAISGRDPVAVANDIPRIYALHKNFFQMRLDRIRNAEISKRNRERLKNPSVFPSVPSGDL